MAKKTKPRPLSLRALVVWLRTKPPGRRYPYMNNQECLAAQYNRSIGRDYNTPQIMADSGFDCRIEEISSEPPWTFGDALKRAQQRARC